MSSICHKRAKTRKKGAPVPHKRAKNTPGIKPNGMTPGVAFIKAAHGLRHRAETAREIANN